MDLTKRIKVTVPVHTEGEPNGVKVQGGLLEIITRSVEIECLPDEIPESFTVNVSELNIGQSKRASDVAVEWFHEADQRPESVIAHIVALRPKKSPATRSKSLPATAAEPEVVKKGKKEEEARGRREGARKSKYVPGGRSGEPGRGVRSFAAQSGFHGGRPAGRAARHSHQPQGFQGARRRGRNRRARGDAGQTANFYEPQRHFARAADGKARIDRPDCVVYDELDLPWMAVKIKPKGSAAGHNGMKSVIRSLKTSEIVRLRLGIHPGHALHSGADFVLAPIKRSQRKELDELVDYAADGVRSIIAEGVEKAMTKYNRRARGLNNEEA